MKSFREVVTCLETNKKLVGKVFSESLQEILICIFETPFNEVVFLSQLHVQFTCPYFNITLWENPICNFFFLMTS